jgi:hypothetical protein
MDCWGDAGNFGIVKSSTVGTAENEPAVGNVFATALAAGWSFCAIVSETAPMT